ncbi:expansin-A14-like [Hordeum vulgare]|uniref:Expansin n=1 Tax=Hordeum vulgare subsp. vulgare TaxID=112509 RepID=A0A8I6YY59_HORVV|nr:expansin-A14-like [Hordeum vulgare subsp. vulgare]KAE8789650.1 expansin-A14-like [Hordeum vulgare]
MARATVIAALVMALLGCALAVAADDVAPSASRPMAQPPSGGLAPEPQPPASRGLLKAHATFYGGADGAGTMGGACGYGNLYSAGYGTSTTALLNDGASCGQCYKIACDSKRVDTRWCKLGEVVTVTATNFCPPNYDLPSDDGGWCNPPRPHFDMAQPAWEKIGVYRAGIIPVVYQRVPCVRRGGVRFTINGHDYFQLVLVTNVATIGSIKSMDVKGSESPDWMPMARNWGANWHSLAYLTGQRRSFRVTNDDGQTRTFTNVVPSGWKFGQTFASNVQFK